MEFRIQYALIKGHDVPALLGHHANFRSMVIHAPQMAEYGSPEVKEAIRTLRENEFHLVFESTQRDREAVSTRFLWFELNTPPKGWCEYHGATHGLATELEEWLTEYEFYARRPEAFEPNRSWFSVRFKNHADARKWMRAENAWLASAWAPNQTREEQRENAAQMKELEAQMRALELE